MLLIFLTVHLTAHNCAAHVMTHRTVWDRSQTGTVLSFHVPSNAGCVPTRMHVSHSVTCPPRRDVSPPRMHVSPSVFLDRPSSSAKGYHQGDATQGQMFEMLTSLVGK